MILILEPNVNANKDVSVNLDIIGNFYFLFFLLSDFYSILKNRSVMIKASV